MRVIRKHTSVLKPVVDVNLRYNVILDHIRRSETGLSTEVLLRNQILGFTGRNGFEQSLFDQLVLRNL